MNFWPISTPSRLERELTGHSSLILRGQLHHLIGAERPWIGVPEGQVQAIPSQPETPPEDWICRSPPEGPS